MITAAGIGSGIDIESIIDQLMVLEREPINALEQRRSRLDVELSAYGSAKSAMNELATTARTLGDSARISPFLTTSSDEDVATATASGAASNESHEIVVTRLASTHRIASDAYVDDTSDVGSGEWSFSSSGNDFSVTLANGDSSVRALRDAINDSVDNTSVVASLLNVDGGTRLILSARESGSAGEITARKPGLFGVPVDAGFQQTAAALDAKLSVDGFAVSSSGNTVTGVIEGVNLELSGIGTTTLSTQRDSEAMRTSLDTFVEQYNALRNNLKASADNALSGDRLPRNIETQLRSVFNQPLADGANAGRTATEFGFTFDKDGVLSIDSGRLSAMQEEGMERFIDAFTRESTGFAATFTDALELYTRAGGRIADREDGVGRRRETINDNIERQEYRLEQTERRYRRQFTAMDQIVSQLQSTSAFLVERLQQP